ncbi:proton myo-inositol cotransporter-like isoform X2 [Gordionus sp. m RMFG-2023]|uniref:proton myo-inositol cotransporter-like isoform X2 n=1 Tax=Gordionus sp. m RMFG-2023 TaxID=3053472 RepID=UPI0031FD28AE
MSKGAHIHPESSLSKIYPLSHKPSHNISDAEDSLLIDNAKSKTPKFVYIITIFAAIGGFLFGYDTGVISGAMLLLKDNFNLNSLWQETIVSATIGAAIIFALIGGILNDIIGRKMTIMIASIIFISGSMCLAFALSEVSLIIGRTILGCGIGLASMSVPIYIAEMSPPDRRGRLVTLNSVFVTGGQFIASVIDGIFSYDRKNGWRYMLGLAALPAGIQLAAFLFLPESPRWLVKKGKDEKAKAVLAQISGSFDTAEASYKDIKGAMSDQVIATHPPFGDNDRRDGLNQRPNQNKGTILWQIFENPVTRRALLLGCSLQIFQQLCGINTVMYYSATIIEMSGVRDKSKAIWLSAATAFVNFVCTFLGLYLVEKIGRRTLTLFSLAGVIISLSLLAIGFQLAAVLSPPVTYHPKEFANNPCDAYTYCYACVEDRSCGFCYVEDPEDRNRALNGSCLPTTRDNSTRPYYGRCMNGIPTLADETPMEQDKENFYKVQGNKARNYEYKGSKRSIKNDDDLIWAYNFCPTEFYWLPIFGLFCYLFFFAPGMGPMPWTINSEIYPLWARSTGNSVASACNWMTNLLVSMTFLTLTEKIGKHVTFWIYTTFACLGFLIFLRYLPETKGKSLEDMEMIFSEKSPILSSPLSSSQPSSKNVKDDSKSKHAKNNKNKAGSSDKFQVDHED